MPQIKEQEKSLEKELNEMEGSIYQIQNLKILIIRILKELSENFNNMKNKHKNHKKRTTQKWRIQYLK